MFDKFGRVEGYGQMAPGRDTEELDEFGQPKRSPSNAQGPNIQTAIGGMPVGGVTPFKGAQDTIGAKPANAPQPTNANIQSAIGHNNGAVDIGSMFTDMQQSGDWRTHMQTSNGGIGAGRQGSQAPQDGGSVMDRLQFQTPLQAPAQNPSPTAGLGQVQAPPLQAPPSVPAPTPQPPSASPVDTSAWDTDGYPKPGYVPTSFGEAPRGRNPQKWNDPNHQSPKYVVSRILAEQGPPSREQVIRALPNLQKAYPGTTFDGKDKLTIPGVGTVDVLTASGSTDPNQVRYNSWNPILDKDGNPSKHARNAQGNPALMRSAILGSGMASPIPTNDSDYSARLMQQIMQALQADPQLAAIAQSNGY